MSSYVVLLSSGLDSTVNLYAAAREGKVKLALTFDYGQRAAPQEISHSRRLCEKLKIDHRVIVLPWLREITNTALVNLDVPVPVDGDVDMNCLVKSASTAQKVWVPNRYGVFLNIAASFAETLGADYVVPGFNIEEAQTFPDNSECFLTAVTHAFSFSTATRVQAHSFTHAMDKTAILRLGRELSVDFNLVWPCYFAGETLCERCESCQRFFRAMRASLPNEYLEQV